MRAFVVRGAVSHIFFFIIAKNAKNTETRCKKGSKINIIMSILR